MAQPSPRPSWLPGERMKHGGNFEVNPEKWSMSVKQFQDFIGACQADSSWTQLKEAQVEDANGAVLKAAGHVNCYQLCDQFVKPWTLGTGSSIALLMNEQPTLADLMVSHSWAESLEELLEIFLNMSQKEGGLKPTWLGHMIEKGNRDADSFPPESRIWFCLLAIYQPGDDGVGPSIPHQLSLDPFGKVIHSEATKAMIVAHTTAAEVYDRLWCCYEIDRAIAERGMRGVGEHTGKDFAQGLFSKAYINKVDAGGLVSTFLTQSFNSVKTAEAKCSCEEDKKMITDIIMKDGGFDRLDEIISFFRFGWGHSGGMMARLKAGGLV